MHKSLGSDSAHSGWATAASSHAARLLTIRVNPHHGRELRLFNNGWVMIAAVVSALIDRISIHAWRLFTTEQNVRDIAAGAAYAFGRDALGSNSDLCSTLMRSIRTKANTQSCDAFLKAGC